MTYIEFDHHGTCLNHRNRLALSSVALFLLLFFWLS
jgi:hypothetical protein